MKRLLCVATITGLVLLATHSWLGETALSPQLVSELFSGWSTATTAYAAPPSQGIVSRAAHHDSLEMEDATPGIVVSDRKDRVARAAGTQPAAASSRSAASNGFDAALPGDEPDELVASNPLPARRTPPSNEHFVSRRRSATHQPTPQPARPAPLAPADLKPVPRKPAAAEAEQAEPKHFQTDAAVSTEPLGSPRYPDSSISTEGRLPAAEQTAHDHHDAQLPPTQPQTAASRGMAATADVSAEPAYEPSVPEPLEAHAAADAEPGTSAAAVAESVPAESVPAEPVPAEPAPLENPQPTDEPAHLTDSPYAATSTNATNDANEGLSGSSQPQAPQHGVLLNWITPAEVQVDAETEFQLNLENATDAALAQVVVEAQLPAGVRLVRAEPAVRARGKLGWNFAALDAHEQRTIRLWVVPTGEGEVVPTATVTFSNASVARLQVIHPQLQIAASGPAAVLAGQPTGVRFVVSNPGTGKARNVVVELQLDPGLKHPAGSQLRYALGALAGGESREVQVALNPTDAGNFAVHATTTAEPGLSAEARFELEVSKPTLRVAVEGPRLRYVDRQATYVIKIHNPGSSPAENVQVFDDIPNGFRFVDASSGGTFDATSRQVAWFVGRLEPNQTTEVNVQLIATEPGEQRIAAAVKADAGVSETAEAVTRVEGVASVVLDVIDADDPIEVAGETTYEIRLTNRGSKPALKVQPAAKLPPELQAIEATGATTGKIQGATVVFDPIDSLAPGQTEVFRVRVHCRQAGQVTFRAFYRDADHPNPVSEEEVTRIYQD